MDNPQLGRGEERARRTGGQVEGGGGARTGAGPSGRGARGRPRLCPGGPPTGGATCVTPMRPRPPEPGSGEGASAWGRARPGRRGAVRGLSRRAGDAAELRACARGPDSPRSLRSRTFPGGERSGTCGRQDDQPGGHAEQGNRLPEPRSSEAGKGKLPLLTAGVGSLWTTSKVQGRGHLWLHRCGVGSAWPGSPERKPPPPTRGCAGGGGAARSAFGASRSSCEESRFHWTAPLPGAKGPVTGSASCVSGRRPESRALAGLWTLVFSSRGSLQAGSLVFYKIQR